MARKVIPIRLDDAAVRQADRAASFIAEHPDRYPRLREYTTRSAILRLAIALGLERIEDDLRQPILPLDSPPQQT
ncbi:MAG: hypothetical protein GY778_28750 [bacterium]|nr:hypothetical protein [bacterium]